MIARSILALAAPLAMAAQDVPEPPRGAILCELALAGWAEEVATRCAPKATPEVQAALRDGISRIQLYVRARSDWSEAELDAFVHDQSGGALSDAQLCGNDDARHIQAMLAKATPEKIRSEADRSVTGERPITMDPCL